MKTFISLVQWTPQGVKNVQHTTKRAEAFEAAVQKAGGRVRDVFWTMGRYDGVLIFDAPDEEVATALMLGVAGLGNVRSETLRAFGTAEMARILKKRG